MPRPSCDPATASPTREMELLLRCARSALCPSQEAEVRRLLGAGVAWDALLRLARHHRLTPLLFRHLSRVADAGVPAEVLHTLRQEFVLTAAHSRKLAEHLRELLVLLEEQGIHALPYKGPVLAQQVYGDVAFRQMTDLDVLVRRADVGRALALLLRHGYHSPYHPTPAQLNALLRADNNYQLQSDDGARPAVELHWAFTVRHPIEALDLEELQGSLRSTQLAGMQMPAFASEDLLLVLCFHGARHMWERLAWLTDVAELVRAGGIEWEQTLQRAARFGSRRTLLLGLHLAERLLDAPVPAPVLERVRADPLVPRLAEQVCARLFGGDDRPAHSLGAPFHRFQLRTIDRLRGRVRYLYRSLLIPTAKDWRALPLPDSLFPLYFLVRPFRLAARYAAPRGRRPGGSGG